MSLDLCEMSLQQIKQLLSLTDTTIQNICCKRFTGDELYAEALQQVLGGRGRRGPAGISIVFREEEGAFCRGKMLHLVGGAIVERAEIIIDTGSAYAASLLHSGTQRDVLVANWADSYETLEVFQSNFPDEIRAFIAEPIKNFVTCRISGDRPGAIIALNYPGRATDYDAEILRSLAVVIGSLLTLSDEVRETEQAFIYTINALARACEAAEEETGRHIQRVNRYAGALAANAGCSADLVDAISYSAQMHDVGKIKVPSTILLKAGGLNAEEQALMRLHPVYGKEIIGTAPRLSVARDIAIAHHENWDGTGYPYGLKGEEIPLPGRIVKIADVYDALRSKRSYKEPLDHAAAVLILRDGDNRIDPGAHFDPVLLATFFKIDHMFEKIYESQEGKGNIP